MKKVLSILLLVFASGILKSQLNSECVNNIPLCSTPDFTFSQVPPPNYGLIDELTYPSISNPGVNPGSNNAGCLATNENNPQWLLITVGNAGMLEFVFGAANSPYPQSGFYDWAMWPYSPTACSQIFNNTLPPVRCNWNGPGSGGTGIASPGNIPPGGSQSNFEPPLAVNACQQFIICISNYSNINTLVSFQSLGTASLSCNPNCNANYLICSGKSVTVNASNFNNLANPVFSIQPTGQVNNTGTFVVTPMVTTSYTTYCTGTDPGGAVQTTTGVSTVTVFPNPVVAPTTTQATCGNTVNAVNLNLSFSPGGGPTPNYTVTWSPVPPGINSPTQTTATNLTPGITNVTVTTAGGCSTTASFSMSPVPSVANFTITPPGATYSLTCTNTLITLNAAPVNYTYTWISLSYTTTGTSASFTPGMQGSYTVTSNNGIAGCAVTQTFTIGQNTVAPTNSVNPVSQVVTCNSGAPVTFSGTVTNPTVNIQHDWYSPLNPLPNGVPIATSNNTISILSGNVPPGVYTLQTTNLVNGCTTIKTVTITSLSSFPTFSLYSPTNFSVGCSPLNQTTISIINPVSTQTPPSTCSFTFLPPGFGGVVTPSVVLDPTNSSTITTLPGTWTVIVQDNSNFCRTEISVPVIQNTLAPNVEASMLTQTLTCKNSTVLATGTSSTANTVITWNVPSNPPTLSTPTVAIGDIANGPATSTTSLTYANFTVVATNSLNACISTSVVTISQNFRPPVARPMISLATPTAIYCTVDKAPVVLSSGSSSTTSGGGPTAFVANPCWAGPSPQTTICGASNYSASVAGIYSLTVEDNYNGCKHTGTVNVVDRTQPPELIDALSTATLQCGADTALFEIKVQGSTTGMRYLVNRYPQGAAFSPTAITAVSTNPFLSGSPTSKVGVDQPGQYIYIVTNTVTGCRSTGTVNVILGDLNVNFEPQPATGYAPLSVNFDYNANLSGINSSWNFGNGASTTSSTGINPSAVYNAPGIYTVSLLVQKGGCIDTVYKIIKVDIPSKLEIPNIFSPNGDGSNDVFFVQASNLSEISAIVFDRWGNKVYDVNSTTGNIAWDGKNLNGKESAAGVYLYVIKAKGKDGQEYEKKGNITLVR